jgi:hypothetical protein
VLVDATWKGQARKLLLHADRNGFFYVFDRLNGELLLAKAFVDKLTWAKEIGPDKRPVMNPNQDPTTEGTRVCPSLEGATNWYSTSFNPSTGLYYVQTLEDCATFTKRDVPWKAGSGYMGGTWRREPGQQILRAFDIATGTPRWELSQTGPANSWGGVLSTAGGVVLFGEDGGLFTAVDAKSGKRLWQWPTGQVWRSSPMTYVFDGKQYIAAAVGRTLWRSAWCRRIRACTENGKTRNIWLANRSLDETNHETNRDRRRVAAGMRGGDIHCGTIRQRRVTRGCGMAQLCGGFVQHEVFAAGSDQCGQREQVARGVAVEVEQLWAAQ